MDFFKLHLRSLFEYLVLSTSRYKKFTWALTLFSQNSSPPTHTGVTVSMFVLTVLRSCSSWFQTLTVFVYFSSCGCTDHSHRRASESGPVRSYTRRKNVSRMAADSRSGRHGWNKKQIPDIRGKLQIKAAVPFNDYNPFLTGVTAEFIWGQLSCSRKDSHNQVIQTCDLFAYFCEWMSIWTPLNFIILVLKNSVIMLGAYILIQ